MSGQNKPIFLSLILNNEAMSLAVLTACSLLISFAWECGKLSFYGVPYWFMELNTITILVSSIFFILIFSPLIIEVIISYKQDQKEKKTLIFRYIILSFCYSIPAYIVSALLFSDNQHININVILLSLLTLCPLFLILFFLLAGLPVLLSCNLSFFRYFRTLIELERTLCFKAKNLSKRYFHLLCVLLYLFITVFFISVGLSSNQKIYWMIEGEPDAFIITSYGDRVLVGHFLENKKIISECIEVRNISYKPLNLFKVKLSKPPTKATKKSISQCI